MNTVYDYIATTDPYSAKKIVEDFGYTITNPKDMSANLKTLVNNEGEDALRCIMEAHPDKDIILEFFGKKESSKKNDRSDANDFGGSNPYFGFNQGMQYANASGSEKTDANILVSNTNTMIFASALILAVAIIFKNDK